MRDDPRIRCFTLQIFRYENSRVTLDSDREYFGDVNMIELLCGASSLFELLPCRWIDACDWNQLHRDRFVRTGIDRLAINAGTGTADLTGLSIFSGRDPIMFKKSSLIHTFNPVQPASGQNGAVKTPKIRLRRRRIIHLHVRATASRSKI